MKTVLRFALLIACPFLFACNNSSKNTDDLNDTTQIVADPIVVASPEINKDVLIDQLNSLSLALKTRDKVKIASFLNFPLADSTFYLADVSPAFDSLKVLNNDLVSKKMFIDHFERVQEFMELDGFNELFKKLNINDLKTSNEVVKVVADKEDGCAYHYDISIRDNQILIHYGTNTNPDYVNPNPENEEVCSEFASMWTFKLENNKLVLLKKQNAG